MRILEVHQATCADASNLEMSQQNAVLQIITSFKY